MQLSMTLLIKTIPNNALISKIRKVAVVTITSIHILNMLKEYGTEGYKGTRKYLLLLPLKCLQFRDKKLNGINRKLFDQFGL